MDNATNPGWNTNIYHAGNDNNPVYVFSYSGTGVLNLNFIANYYTDYSIKTNQGNNGLIINNGNSLNADQQLSLLLNENSWPPGLSVDDISNGGDTNQGEESKTSENVITLINGADNTLTLAGIPHYIKTGEEVGGVLHWAGKVTGLASLGSNLYKGWNERHTNKWQAGIHFSEAAIQAGIMVFGGEEVELLWNLGSFAIDSGVDYYNDSHRH